MGKSETLYTEPNKAELHLWNHLKHDHAGKDGERRKHDIVDRRNNSSVKGVQCLQM